MNPGQGGGEVVRVCLVYNVTSAITLQQSIHTFVFPSLDTKGGRDLMRWCLAPAPRWR